MSSLLPDPELKLLPPPMVQVSAAVHPLRTERLLSQVEAGRTVTSVIEQLVPDNYIESLVVSIDGEIVPPAEWDDRHLLPSDIVVFRALPQGGGGSKILRSILMLAVIAIAFAVLGPVGGFTAGGLFAAGGTAALVTYGIAFAAINMIGNLLINALIPPPSVGNTGPANSIQTFGISGIQNQELPYGVVPRIFGRTLMTPPKGAHSYTMSTGTDTYLFALFDLGPGPIAISNIQLGQTPIGDFSNVEYETREGRIGEAAITLFQNAVHQTPLSILLNNGVANTQRTPINTTHVEIDLSGPSGIYGLNSSGNFIAHTVTYLIQLKNLGGSVLDSASVSLVGRDQAALAQTYSFADQPSGQYDITVTRTSAEPTVKQGSAKSYWTTLRSWGDATGPLLPEDHAQIAVKIKANEQLNGDIQNLNCIAQAYVQVWNGTTFSEALNTHPAWACYTVLTGSSNARPLDDSRIDLASLLDWATTYPSAEFNYVFSQRSTIWQVLRTIAPAGRAIPVIRDGLYSFVFDEVQSNPVQMFTARNVQGFKANKTFFDEIDGMEIRYISETMGWQEHSVYVYAAGITALTADPNKITPLNLTGVTGDSWAYKLGSYFFAAAALRPTIYQFTTDLDHLACNPGDRIWVQHDVIGAGVTSGRITALTRNGSSQITSITLDESFTGDGASTYKLQVRSDDTHIHTVAGTVPASLGQVFTVTPAYVDTGHTIKIGDLVSLTTTVVTMLDAIVKTITPSANFKAIVSCFDYVAAIHAGDAVTPPPVVNDRINNFLHTLPTSSVFIQFLTSDETAAMHAPNGATISQIHGTFYISDDGIAPEKVEVQWRISGEVGWKALPDMPASARQFYLPASASHVGDTYEVRIRGNRIDNANPGPWDSSSITFSGYSLQPIAPSVAITPIISGFKAAITPGGYDSVVSYRLYANTVNNFGTSSMVVSGPSSPLQWNGVKPPTVYFFWATTVNGLGVESLPSTVASAIALPVGYDALDPDLQAYQNYVGNALRDIQDTVDLVNQSVDSLVLGSYQDSSQILTELRSTSGALTADYTQKIQTVVSDQSALVNTVTLLQASLNGVTGANGVTSAIATAVQSMSAYVDAATGAFSSSLSAVSAQVGNLYAAGQIRMTSQAAPGGASARVAISAAASSGSGANAAAIYLDAMTGGATRIVMIADQIFMTDGSTNTAPFFFSSGTLYMNNVVVQNIDAANITSGSLAAGRIAAGTIVSSMLTANVIDTSTLILGGVVITSHMASNAITNSAVSLGGTTAIGLSSWTTLASITVTTTGGLILISFTDYSTWSSAGPRGFYRLIRDLSTVVTLVGFGGGSCPDYLIVAGSGLDTSVSAGSHTWYLQAEYVAGNQPTSQAPYLILTELKR